VPPVNIEWILEWLTETALRIRQIVAKTLIKQMTTANVGRYSNLEVIQELTEYKAKAGTLRNVEMSKGLL
jgi:hypothetical protein